MRLLILGASGFLGRHTERQAAAAGAEVVTAGRSRPRTAGSTWPPTSRTGSPG
jgi:uncharacterized protein YbjT (DUF2867 family)